MQKRLITLSLLLLSLTCSADTITVTTTNDVVDADICIGITINELPGPDGEVSLREAVCAANATLGDDIIILPAGVFALTLGGSGENESAAGDLDISETVTITGAGLDMTFIENGIGDVAILGDGDRVFEVGNGFVGGIDLTLEDLTVRNGDIGCTGIDCFSGAGAIHSESTGTVTLTRVSVENNQTSCTGDCCGSEINSAAIGLYGAGNLTVNDGFLNNNRASCSNTAATLPACVDQGNGTFVLTPSCEAGRSLMVFLDLMDNNATVQANFSNTQIEGNISECNGEACRAGEMIGFDGVDIEGPETSNVVMNNVQITNNVNQCTGQNCETDELVELDRPGLGSTTVQNTVVDSNTLQCVGESCDVDEIFPLDGEPGIVMILDSEFTNNVLTCNGDPDGDGVNNIVIGFDSKKTPIFNARACDTDEVVELDTADQLTVMRTLVADNQQTCTGIGCDTDEAFSFANIETSVVIDRVQVLRNLHQCDGIDCDTDEIIDFNVDDGAVGTFANSIVADNTVTCTGTNCRCDVAGIHIDNRSTGTHTIRDSTFSGNVSTGDDTPIPSIDSDCAARSTGGIRLVNASLTVINTTITNNMGVSSGAGILNAGDLTLSHVTISNNTSDSDNDGTGSGAGICNNQVINIVDGEGVGTCTLSETAVDFDPNNETGTITMDNSIVAFNNANGMASNCDGLITSDGFNMMDDLTDCMVTGDVTVADPLLNALADNNCRDSLPDGSCVPTQSLMTGSPALDAGSCTTSDINQDQRGFFRPFDNQDVANADDGCDIGAFEFIIESIFSDGFEL